jgi:hypothetical protein
MSMTAIIICFKKKIGFFKNYNFFIFFVFTISDHPVRVTASTASSLQKQLLKTKGAA